MIALNAPCAMESSLLCQEMEDLVEQSGIVVRYESFDDPEVIHRNGLCIIKGKPVLFIEKGATIEKRIQLFGDCLRRMDLGNVYLKPAVRDYLKGVRGHADTSMATEEGGNTST